MAQNKKQLLRLIRLVAELKKKSYPNSRSFAKKLRDSDLYDETNIKCCNKTIQRDVKTLKEEFNAPIAYDYERKGYYLNHHGWDFSIPALEESYLIASLLGAKIAEDTFPEPLKSEINNAVNLQLTTNNPDLLDTANINTFITNYMTKVKIEPEVFKVVFLAWKQHNTIKISHKRYQTGEETERKIDPYIITYYNSAWYLKAFCHLRNETRTFAIHRITKAELTDYEFETPKDILKAPGTAKPFSDNGVQNIELWCSPAISGYVMERDIKGQRYKLNADDSVNLYIESAPWYTITRWILSEAGNIKVIKPESLRKDIISMAENILKINI